MLKNPLHYFVWHCTNSFIWRAVYHIFILFMVKALKINWPSAHKDLYHLILRTKEHLNATRVGGQDRGVFCKRQSHVISQTSVTAFTKPHSSTARNVPLTPLSANCKSQWVEALINCWGLHSSSSHFSKLLGCQLNQDVISSCITMFLKSICRLAQNIKTIF